MQMARNGSRETQGQKRPSGQRDWHETPVGKIVIAIISGLLLWFIVDRIVSLRDAPPPVVIQVPAKTEPKSEDKGSQSEAAKPRRPKVQGPEEQKERDAPANPDAP